MVKQRIHQEIHLRSCTVTNIIGRFKRIFLQLQEGLMVTATVAGQQLKIAQWVESASDVYDGL
jgi:hypothetical protein